MANRSKAKGTTFESAVVKYLRDALGDDRIDRLALHGSKDNGDIGHVFAHGNRGVIECKAHKKVTRSLISEWREQTIDERENSDSDFALLVVKYPQHSVAESFVHVTVADLSKICLGVELTNETKCSEAWVTMTLEQAAMMIGSDCVD